MIRRPPRSTQSRSSAASDVYKRQVRRTIRSSMPVAHPDSRAYRVLAAVVRPILFALSRRRWSGGEHLPQSGGCIVVANHATYLDALTFAHFVYDHGRASRILAKSPLFKIPLFGAILRATGMIPVYRNLSLIHISEPTRLGMISYAVFCLKKKKKNSTYIYSIETNQ